MNYDVVEAPPATYAVIHGTVPREQVADTIRSSIEEVARWAQPDAVAGPPLTISAMTPTGELDLRVGWQVRDDADVPPPPIELVHAPATRAAVHVHVGPYDALPNIYQELWDALSADGLAPADNPRELYESDPEE